MSKTKFTPGPWKVGTYEDTGYSIDATHELNYIAQVHGGYEPTDECYANAKLIAAAPEMYDYLQNIANGNYPDLDILQSLLNKITNE